MVYYRPTGRPKMDVRDVLPDHSVNANAQEESLMDPTQIFVTNPPQIHQVH